MSYRITALRALEILDSRGRPTVGVHLELDDGTVGEAGVPSGASRGSREAVERRDGDPRRFGGDGVRSVVATVEDDIADAVVGPAWPSLEDLDAALCALDGTPDKERLGGNAIVGISMAAARAFAAADGLPLYRWLPRVSPPRLPVPHFNVVNGGRHARNRLDFQEFMVAPLGAPSFAEALRAGVEIYGCLREALGRLGFATGLGDEGGFAPALQAPEDVLDLLTEAITTAGYEVGPDGVAIALDPAASELREDVGTYHVNGSHFDSVDMVEYLAYLTDRYPIWSIEDGVAQDDAKGWELLTERLAGRVQLVGDDNLVTNADLIAQAIRRRQGTAGLIKVNQVGTVTETLQAVRTCYLGGFDAMVSHRSGETTDPFIADLAVAVGCGQIKAGAPARGERVAKYNRLLAIEAEEPDLPYGRRPR
ncbi:MAG TPA: phosphopyruvate hydratase [Acidimicrobiales bacterium]|nr:phosphopyruvate hydratase [Acidimicrobiales bacterium]